MNVTTWQANTSIAVPLMTTTAKVPFCLDVSYFLPAILLLALFLGAKQEQHCH